MPGAVRQSYDRVLQSNGVSQQLAELFRENQAGTLGVEIARRALAGPRQQTAIR